MLLIATIEDFFNFELNNIELLISLGYEVHIACDLKASKKPIKNTLVRKHQIDFKRNPLSFRNVKAFFQLNKLFKNNDYSFIHCHTPVGGFFGRVIGIIKNKKVMYTAHGFHFFKGSSVLNWLIFYPIEKILSVFTDTLITINKEDYELAKKKFKSKNIRYIPGVGITLDNKAKCNLEEIRLIKDKFNISNKDIVMVAVGELSKRKNHITLIKAISKLNNKNIKCFICGEGRLRDFLIKETKKLGVSEQVHIVGFQNNVFNYLSVANLFVFPSLQEGLPVALMEAMTLGVPVIASNIRGNNDLVIDGYNGYLVSPMNVEEYVCAMNKVIFSEWISCMFSENSFKTIQKFNKTNCISIMNDLYKDMCL